MRYLERNWLWTVIAAPSLLCAACSGAGDEPTTSSTTDPLATQGASRPLHFHANLSGKNEVPAVDTNARGEITLDASTEGELTYRLIVANITDVRLAHIHCAPAGENGPIGVTLFMGGPVSPNGTLTQATVTAPDAQNACGWADVAAVIDAITAGNAYSNVHTLANPTGEIRGQLR